MLASASEDGTVRFWRIGPEPGADAAAGGGGGGAVAAGGKAKGGAARGGKGDGAAAEDGGALSYHYLSLSLSPSFPPFL